MGRYSLGVNNAWAVKRFVEPESWVEIAASMDIDSVQFSLDLLDPSVDKVAAGRIIDETVEECDKYGVRLHSCFTGISAYSFNLLLHPDMEMRAWAFQWYSRALEIASELGVKTVGGHMGSISSRDNGDRRRRNDLLAQLIGSIDRLTQEAKRLGLTALLWEPMPNFREPPSSVKEAKKMLSRVNKRASVPVKLCIDVGHACNPGLKGTRDSDPYYWLSELGMESPCVHVQQTDGAADRHWPFTPGFNKVGVIKPEKVLAALDESGAKDVCLMLEAVPPFEQPDGEVVRDMKQSIRYWRQFV